MERHLFEAPPTRALISFPSFREFNLANFSFAPIRVWLCVTSTGAAMTRHEQMVFRKECNRHKLAKLCAMMSSLMVTTLARVAPVQKVVNKRYIENRNSRGMIDRNRKELPTKSRIQILCNCLNRCDNKMETTVAGNLKIIQLNKCKLLIGYFKNSDGHRSLQHCP